MNASPHTLCKEYLYSLSSFDQTYKVKIVQLAISSHYEHAPLPFLTD